MLKPMWCPLDDWLWCTGRTHPGNGTSRAEITAAVEDIRTLLQQAQAGGAIQDLLVVVRQIERSAPQIERTIIVWIDLVEVLVQTAERRLGPTPGRGSLKKADVRAVTYYLLQAGRFNLPHVPRAFQPVVVDIAAGEITDILVDIANHFGLWTADDQSRRGIVATAVRFSLARLGAWLTLAFQPVAWLVTQVVGWRYRRGPLSPRVRAALAAVEREGLIAREPEEVADVEALARWVLDYPRQAAALVRLVFTAVDQVEAFASMTGPEKKAYAKDLVLVVLEEFGFPAGGLFEAVAGGVADVAIEVAVELFNKRGRFLHRAAGGAL